MIETTNQSFDIVSSGPHLFSTAVAVKSTADRGLGHTEVGKVSFKKTRY